MVGGLGSMNPALIVCTYVCMYWNHRDQMVIRHGRDTEVYWAEGNGAPELVYGGEREKVGR